MKRKLTQGEMNLIDQALLLAASQEHLQQINSDILAEYADRKEDKDRSAIKRLRESAAEYSQRRRAMELLANLVSRGYLIVEGPLMIPEIA